MVICLERGADLHTAQLMPLPLTVSCSSKIQIGLTFLVLAHLGSPGKRAVKRVCVFVCVTRKEAAVLFSPRQTQNHSDQRRCSPGTGQNFLIGFVSLTGEFGRG